MESLYCHCEMPHPKELASAALLDWALWHFEKMAPLHKWLVGMQQRVK
jgi:hypothetical protein